MNIYQAINAVMADCGAIGKDTKNQQQGFFYRGVDAVMNALQPLMVKHQIFVVPEVLEQTREERQTAKGSNLLYSILRIKYTFYASDGTSVQAIVTGEGMDSGDKASNKAMSVAFKYACFQVFCIPTEEMKDPDADTPPASAKIFQAKPRAVPISLIDAVITEADRVGWSNAKLMANLSKMCGSDCDKIDNASEEDCNKMLAYLKGKPDKIMHDDPLA